MIIKKKESRDHIGKALGALRHVRILFGWKFLALANLSALIVIMTVLALVGIYTNEGGRVLKRITDLRMYPAVFYQYAKAQFYIPKDVILDIKHMEMQKILFARETRLDATKERIEEYVPVKFRYQGQTLKAKIRLKGDRKAHFGDIDKMSFRVKMKGNDALWGMRVFSIHKPRARNYVHEWIFHTMMAEQGLVSLRYKFFNLTINGKNLGTYAAEEHLAKELIENHDRRDGPILHFEERGLSTFRTLRVAVYNDDDWLDPEALPIVERATFLLTGFQRGDLSFDQVFDAKKMAQFYAVNDLLGTYHSGVTKSLRFYYNPISGKLEPISYDGHFGTIYYPVLSAELGRSLEAGRWIYRGYREWMLAVFNREIGINDTFYTEYARTLTTLTQPNFLEDFFDRNKKELADNLASIYRDMPLADNIAYFGPVPHYFSKRRLFDRQLALAYKLTDIDLDAHVAEETSDHIMIDVGVTRGVLPVIITSISCGENVYKANQQIPLVPQPNDQKDKIIRITFSKSSVPVTHAPPARCESIEFKVMGIEGQRTADVLGWGSYSNVLNMPDFLLSTKFGLASTLPDGIEVDSNGDWRPTGANLTFERDLIIPAGVRLIVQAGTLLNFEKGAMLLSYSPVDLSGSPDHPVTIRSSDQSSNGIAILNAAGRSTWQNAKLEQLSNPKKTGWNLPGAVTFYESSVEMDSVTFANNTSEDSLNIVRSDFVMNNVVFSQAFADALDLDFSNGSIENSKFLTSGNDAIDMSGSVVRGRNIQIHVVGDKAISVGEHSSAEFREIDIRNSEIGVTSKDNSTLTVDQMTMSKVRLGFVAFQKKPEYGPGQIRANNITMTDIEIPFLVEKGSDVEVEDTRIAPSGENLRDLLYGVKYGKASS